MMPRRLIGARLSGGQQIAGDLLAHEAVERQILVEASIT